MNSTLFRLHFVTDRNFRKTYWGLTLLSFSPSWCGKSVRKLWNPAFILCIRRLSFELAISRRNRLSWSGSPTFKSL